MIDEGPDRQQPCEFRDAAAVIAAGLAIVNRILHVHDGHIDLESEGGVGTVVTIYLPLAMTIESCTGAAI